MKITIGFAGILVAHFLPGSDQSAVSPPAPEDILRTVVGDVYLDGTVSAAELNLVLNHWGQSVDWTLGDFDGDGFVGGGDLDVVLNGWGSNPNPLNTEVLDYAFGYTGRLFDEATGLQNNLNRWYDAKVGRWISEDPISFAGGDANLYRYVGNRVTTSTDPTGLIDGNYVGGGPGGPGYSIPPGPSDSGPAAAYVDGLIPFCDPLQNDGFYDEGEHPGDRLAGQIGQAALASVGTTAITVGVVGAELYGASTIGQRILAGMCVKSGLLAEAGTAGQIAGGALNGIQAVNAVETATTVYDALTD